MSEPGVELARFSRFPTWRLFGFGLLLLFVGDEVFAALRTGELRLPAWLGERGTVLVLAAAVLGLIGLGVELARQLLAELAGQSTIAAIHARGLVVRRRFREHFVPWSSMRGLVPRAESAPQVTFFGTPTAGSSFVVYEVPLVEGPTVLVREAEGGRETATLIAQQLGLPPP